MKYKELLIKCIFILFIISYFFVHLTYIFRDPLSHTRKNISGYYGEEKDSLDVVILGTSSTFSSFIPMEAWDKYGIPSYNFCTNVLFTDAMRYHVREIFKTQHPEVLVIDTAPFLYGHTSSLFLNNESESQLRFNTDGFGLSKNRFELINEIIPSDKSRLNYYFDLLYYHGNENPDILYWTYKTKNIYKGYNNLPVQVAYNNSDKIELTSRISALPEDMDIHLEQLLDELDSYDCKVLFISQPIFYSNENAYMHEYANYLKSRVEEKGYDFLDMAEYADKIGVGDRYDYSLDYLHFHIFSAEKITNFLSKYIQEQYKLPNRKEDDSYTGWNREYAEWLNTKKEEEDMTSQLMKEFAMNQSLTAEQYVDCLFSDYYYGCVFVPKKSELYQKESVKQKISYLHPIMMNNDEGEYYLISGCTENDALTSIDKSREASMQIAVFDKTKGQLLNQAMFMYNNSSEGETLEQIRIE